MNKSNDDDDLENYAKDIAKEIFKNQNKSEFDEDELASGSEELLEKSDAERFPDELEEYTKEERKPKIVKKNKNNK